jgi:hypothetical protein
VLANEILEDLTDSGSFRGDGGLATGRGAQNRGQADIYGHGVSMGELGSRLEIRLHLSPL